MAKKKTIAACKGASRYKGVRAPKCNGGNPCRSCLKKFKIEERERKHAKPSKKEVAAEQLGQMMTEAKTQRDKNKHLFDGIKSDPQLAERVRKKLIKDLWRVWEIPRRILGQSGSRRRYREHGHYSDHLATYIFGTWAEFKRQAELPFEDSLATRSVQRNIAKTARAQGVMHYADKNVKPWDGAYDKLDLSQESVLLQVGSDFHSKFMDPFARRVWLDIAKEHKPDGVRYNGDLADFPKLSRHRQLPGHFALNLQEEIDICTDFMQETREATGFESDHKFILGNHDIRMIYALAEAAPIYCSLDSLKFHELFKLDELEVGLVSRPNFLNPSARMRKNDVAQNWETIAGLFTIVHGFLCGQGAPTKHMQRFMRYGTNGHLHSPQMVSGGSDATGVHQWWQTPCMAYPPAVAAEYMPGPIEFSGWASGFSMFRIFPEERFVSAQMVICTEVAEYQGRVWHITDEERIARELLLEI